MRRCVGAAFANMEMTVTLRTLLRELEFGTTYAPAERLRSRGVATAPADGGLAVVHRRAPSATRLRATGIGRRCPGHVAIRVGRASPGDQSRAGTRTVPRPAGHAG